MTRLNAGEEPVRRNVLAAGGTVAASTLFLALAVVDPITVQAVFGAVGAALAQFGLIAFGAERARDQVSPHHGRFTHHDLRQPLPPAGP